MEDGKHVTKAIIEHDEDTDVEINIKPGRGGWFKIMHHVIESGHWADMTRGEQSVYIVMARWASFGDRNRCFRRRSELLLEAGVSQATFYAAIDGDTRQKGGETIVKTIGLVNRGLIFKVMEGGGMHTAEYEVEQEAGKFRPVVPVRRVGSGARSRNKRSDEVEVRGTASRTPLRSRKQNQSSTVGGDVDAALDEVGVADPKTRRYLAELAGISARVILDTAKRCKDQNRGIGVGAIVRAIAVAARHAETKRQAQADESVRQQSLFEQQREKEEADKQRASADQALLDRLDDDVLRLLRDQAVEARTLPIAARRMGLRSTPNRGVLADMARQQGYDL